MKRQISADRMAQRVLNTASSAVDTGQAWDTLPTAANTDLYSPNQLKGFLTASIVQMPCKAHHWNHQDPPPLWGTESFEGSDWILIKSGGWLDGLYWSGGMTADVVRVSGVGVCMSGRDWGWYTKNTNQDSNYCDGGHQGQTWPSLLNQKRKVISNSITFFAGGNSEQMATIATGLTAISRLCGCFFSRTNSPWLHEVFIEEVKLANRSKALEKRQTSKKPRFFSKFFLTLLSPSAPIRFASLSD